MRTTLAPFALFLLAPVIHAAPQGPPPPSNDTCAAPVSIVGEGLFPWESSGATASGFDGGGSAASVGDPCVAPAEGDLFFVWTAGCCGDYAFDTSGMSTLDTQLNVYTGSDCSASCWEGNDDAFPGFGSSLVLVPDVQAGDMFLVQVGTTTLGEVGTGFLNVVRQQGPCFSCSVTTSCEPATPHSQGGPVLIAGTTTLVDCGCNGGPLTGIGSGRHVEALDGPPGEFAFLLVSRWDGQFLPLFQGVLCLGSPIGRYNSTVAANQGVPALDSLGQFDANGILQSLQGNAASTGGSGFDIPLELPFPPGQTIQPGEFWYFQWWYRDRDANGAPSANFSNVMGMQF